MREIVAGVHFCKERDFKIVGAVLSSNFNIGSACRCLLAKSTDREFSQALTLLGISANSAVRLGCLESETFVKAGYSHGFCWSEIYNALWIAVGKFFKKHKEFGIK